MTTETTTQTVETIIDVAALRLDLLSLLSRADEALNVVGEASTARDYAERLYRLNEDVQRAAYLLAHAIPALRMLSQASTRLAARASGLSEVFGIDCGLDDEITSSIGECVFWGDIEPVFHGLRMDYSNNQLGENIPF